MTTQTAVSDNVYLLEEAYGQGKDVLGGKGHGLVEMTHAGLPVPPGIIISTRVCSQYYENGKRFPESLMPTVMSKLAVVEEKTGKKFGHSLLVSVRSGAPMSMPGMMDTILNLGLNDNVVEYFRSSTGNDRFAYDAYRRFIQMYGKIVEHIEGSKFEDLIDKKKEERHVTSDIELDADDMMDLVAQFKRLFKEETGKEFPSNPEEQLRRAIEAVLQSWNGKRAIEYRRFYKIDDSMGTAVNIVAMIFGNTGENSGSGVGFTRNPSTGEKKLFAEFLINAQGEDVVSGARTPFSIEEIEEKMPDLYSQLLRIAGLLEKHYKDMQDFEFTVENGKLWMLQTRTGKRTAQAAVKIALDFVKDRVITEEDAVMRVEPTQLDQLLHKHIDPEAHVDVLVRGIAASPGAAVGKAIFNTNKAAELGKLGESVILVRRETAPEDIHGMIASQGVLTQRGGKTCHAAVVARGMGKPAVVGAESLIILEDHAQAGDVVINEGDILTIDGGTGDVILGSAPFVDAEISGDLDEFLALSDKFRKTGVWANADTPQMVAKAIEFKAEGFGLVRTERMFNAKNRLPYVQRMIISSSTEERNKWLEKLKEFQKKDFYDIFMAAKGRPVVIRLLDLPQHEFLHAPASPELGDLISKKLPSLKEDNPMLGHRGIRLGITYPEIYEMQAKAIAEAKVAVENPPEEPQNLASSSPSMQKLISDLRNLLEFVHQSQEVTLEKSELSDSPQGNDLTPEQSTLRETEEKLEETLKSLRESSRGVEVRAEIMLPLTSEAEEFTRLRDMIKRILPDSPVGTMIETPRAAVTAQEIAKYADFFSFGTNDLTQMTFGMSRDDAEGKFLVKYVEEKILPANPFEVVDKKGVGRLMKIASEDGRLVNPKLEVGVCGETGGDPESIEFFINEVGVNYTSCSPYRVPIARLASAQAAIKRGSSEVARKYSTA